MARITVEDCLNKVNNRFALIHMGAKRVRLLRKGSEPTISSKNKDIVVALREIAAGKVTKGVKKEGAAAVENSADDVLIPEKASETVENEEQKA